jgi:hypothetical protein
MMKKVMFRLIIVVMVVAAGCATTSGARSTPERSFQTEAKGGAVTITGYTGNAKKITIPEQIGGLPVTAIGEEVFYGKQLTSVIIPDSVVTIGNRAFCRNEITSLIIGKGVTTVGDAAFGVNRLTNVTIPDSVTAIGDAAFNTNKIISVTIPDSVTTIGEGAFMENPLTSVTITANVDIQVTSFSSLLYTLYAKGGRKAAIYTFSRSRNGDFNIMVSNNTVEIESYRGTAKVIVIPEKINSLPVTAIGMAAFAVKGLTSVTIPGSVTAIGNTAFASNVLTRITIGADVTVATSSFPKDFVELYTVRGSQAGTYTRRSLASEWTMQ